MKVYIVLNSQVNTTTTDKVFLKKEDAENYCKYLTQWVEEQEVIE